VFEPEPHSPRKEQTEGIWHRGVGLQNHRCTGAAHIRPNQLSSPTAVEIPLNVEGVRRAFDAITDLRSLAKLHADGDGRIAPIFNRCDDLFMRLVSLRGHRDTNLSTDGLRTESAHQKRKQGGVLHVQDCSPIPRAENTVPTNSPLSINVPTFITHN
jgi:hypothetical protein